MRLHRSQGAGSARNVGVGHSTAPLIAFLDDDDEWQPDKLTVQVATLESLPETVAAVGCGYELIYPDRRRRRVVRAASGLKRTLLERPALLPSTLLVRRSAFESLGGFRTDLPRTQDWEFALRLAEHFDVGHVPDVLAVRSPAVHPPEMLLDGYRRMLEILAPHIATLDRSERRRVLAWHSLVEGVYLTEARQVRAARAAFWRAWRLHPRSVRPALHLVRTVVGESTWRAFMRLRDLRYRTP